MRKREDRQGGIIKEGEAVITKDEEIEDNGRPCRGGDITI